MLSNNKKNKSVKQPLEILQFGEGNFMRCFVQYKMQQAKNEQRSCQKVTIVTPIDNPLYEVFDKQNYKYNVVLRGKINDKIVDDMLFIDIVDKVINPFKDYDSYKKCYMQENLGLIITNTTEAGIVFVESDRFDENLKCSFPAKITKIMYERFKKYGKNGGVTYLCIELIENNADELKKCILKYIKLWDLALEFEEFIINENKFYNTLVDRIVTGYPKDNTEEFNKRLGYVDNLITVGEPYFLWVIQGNKSIAKNFPFLSDGHIIFSNELQVYRERKVKILNGMHTMMVPIALLMGTEYVDEAMKSNVIRVFLQNVLDKEILPTIDMEKAELDDFVASIFERFENPFLKYSFWAISLNSISKWKTRNLCSFEDSYNMTHKLPKGLAFSLGAMYVFYCNYSNKIKDNSDVLDYFKTANFKNNQIELFLSKSEFWGRNLNNIDNLSDYVKNVIQTINNKGIKFAIENYEII